MSTILITGANRGIGLELARVFLADGWSVLACCRRPAEADELQALKADNGQLDVYALDVNDTQAIRRLQAGLKETPIDILFNNAGIFGPRDQGFGQTDEAAWAEVLQTNVIAPMKITEAFIDNVRAGQKKIIAFMGSMMGSLGDNTSGGYYIYRSSKAGVHMVMRSVANDLQQDGIISVAFHPGWVRTRMGGEQAPLSTEESATGLHRVLMILEASDNGSLFTYDGQSLPW